MGNKFHDKDYVVEINVAKMHPHTITHKIILLYEIKTHIPCIISNSQQTGAFSLVSQLYMRRKRKYKH